MGYLFFSYRGTHFRVTQGEFLQTRGQLISAITMPVLYHEAINDSRTKRYIMKGEFQKTKTKQ